MLRAWALGLVGVGVPDRNRVRREAGRECLQQKFNLERVAHQIN